MTVAQTITSSFTTAAAVLTIAMAYVVVVRLWAKVPLREALKRTGITLGLGKWWLVAGALLVPTLAYAWLSFRWMPVTANDTGSPYHALLGQGLRPEIVAAAFAYGVVNAGFAEELLFRGLIGGALGRRMPVWKANTIQALVFLAPHLLILLFRP